MPDQFNQGRISVDFMESSGQPPLEGPKVGRHKAVETGVGGRGGIRTGSQRKDAIFASPQSY